MEGALGAACTGQGVAEGKAGTGVAIELTGVVGYP